MRLCQLQFTPRILVRQRHKTALCEKESVRLQTVGQQTESPSSTTDTELGSSELGPTELGWVLRGPEGLVPEGWEGPKSRAFFPSSAPIIVSFFLWVFSRVFISLSGSSLDFGGVFEALVESNARFRPWAVV